MKIVILDSKTIGDDLNFDKFKDLGELTIYKETNPSEVINRIKDMDIIITNKVKLNESNLSFAPSIKYISLIATGFDNIDTDYCKKNNILVSNVCGYSTNDVCEHTFALLFHLIKKMDYYTNYVYSNLYSNSNMFTHFSNPITGLYGKTWGIIGMGKIGKRVHDVAKAFGLNVICYSKNNIQKGYNYVSFDELLKSSDIISLHCPLNNDTYHLLTYNEFKKMKKNAIVINVARGKVINEYDLAKAIKEGLIYGCGIDTYEQEPIINNHPLTLLDKDKVALTPHNAWGSVEARMRCVNEVYLNVLGFINGNFRNLV